VSRLCVKKRRLGGREEGDSGELVSECRLRVGCRVCVLGACDNDVEMNCNDMDGTTCLRRIMEM
jgi:hypothetical protein